MGEAARQGVESRLIRLCAPVDGLDRRTVTNAAVKNAASRAQPAGSPP
jgi:hypothetical protein